MQKQFYSSDLNLLLTFYEDSTIHGSLKNLQRGSIVQFTGISVAYQSRTELAFFVELSSQNLLSSFSGRIESDRDHQILFLDWIQIAELGSTSCNGAFTFTSDSKQAPSIINFDERFDLFKLSDEVMTR